ncbi:MAG: gluconate 2-dehydrogenase subunit 3 family protein [Bryobacteraceae bacterium]
MKRRDLFKISASAAATLPALAQTTAKPTAIASAAAAWKPKLFDDHQNATVIALSELIIPATDTPGAKAALVNRHLDLLLADGSQEERVAFISGLNWLDGYAIRLHRHPFVKCTSAQQTAMLTTLDTSAEADVAPGHKFFRLAKSWTARIYYNTQIGFQELNKGGRVPSTYGCTHGSHA